MVYFGANRKPPNKEYSFSKPFGEKKKKTGLYRLSIRNYKSLVKILLKLNHPNLIW
jgi:hypothetical protein